MKKIEYEAHKFESGDWAVQITYQTHRCNEFGKGDRNSFHANNGAVLFSCAGPAVSKAVAGLFYVRGKNHTYDNDIVYLSDDAFRRFEAAVAQYNTEFADQPECLTEPSDNLNPLGHSLELIPAGPFLMGSIDADKHAYDDEKPQHMYTFQEPYWIGRCPVTNAQYSAFVRTGGYENPTYWTKAGWETKQSLNLHGPREYKEPFSLPNHPVVGVFWYEAIAYCRWLTALTNGLMTYCLPSEAEWEKAARGPNGRIYPWGHQPNPKMANYHNTNIRATSAVGSFPAGASPYGCLDMSGNVREWTRSAYESYPYVAGDGREDLEAGYATRRVLRGGMFRGHDSYVRCAFRYASDPNYRYYDIGFRVVARLT
ncbi:SUMF1/EgtB/PvdO family nonheme iron enzyme [Candidatus Uhrbacteria bacterium]|nr:SUMF1/EgtB/PvdO family nonheme iron enzyme [Candidatus Uhrbacteria bacterium]